MKTTLIDSESTGEISTKSEMIMEFMNRVEMARGQDDIVETDEGIIKHFCPKGLGDALHFDYRGMKICLKGNREKLEHQLNLTIEEKMHGPK